MKFFARPSCKPIVGVMTRSSGQRKTLPFRTSGCFLHTHDGHIPHDRVLATSMQAGLGMHAWVTGMYTKIM